MFLAGDSHASWVSDLIWLGTQAYNQSTGEGSVGVEFAGTAVSSPCPGGQNISLATANFASALLVQSNPELQYQDLFFRGYYELVVGYDSVNASFYGIPSTIVRNGYELSLANFTVKAGENRLHRPLAGGSVESGSLRGGKTLGSNITHDTATGRWFQYTG